MIHVLSSPPPFLENQPPSSSSSHAKKHSKKQKTNPYQEDRVLISELVSLLLDLVRPDMGQEGAVPAPAATVLFSWEHEPGVSKQSPWSKKPVTTAAVEGARGMPESPRKVAPPARRLSVPPPPGRPSVPATTSFSRARAVRPEDDPFLAAYLACTKSSGGDGGSGKRTAREPKGQRRFTWAGLGLGLGLGLPCKRSNGVVEESMVRLAKLPEVDPRDA